MGVLSNRVERSELAVGDHIYTWRTLFAYSHHGIYVGGNLVVHFTQQNIVSGGDPILFSAPVTCSSASSANECLGRNVSAGIYVSASSTEVSSACGIPKCAFQQKESGVVVSCLNCFLGGGRLYRFEYGVSSPFFLSRVRSGTCTTAQSDPPEEVIHRAMYLLQNGFGDYHIFNNNCEDFALYCKTGLHVLDQKALGRSSQAASVMGGPSSAIVSLLLKLFTSSPASLVVATAGMHCLTSYATDIGVRTDVTKVKVEELTSFCNRKSSKKSINENHSDTGEVTLNQTDAPAKKRQEILLDWKDMGVFSHRVERSELAVGDHIYTWRTLFAYSHHGIYVGGNLVVHFTQQNIVSGGDPILFSAPVTCSSASSANECLGRNVSAGIYVSASSTEVSSACGSPKCAFQQKESGVVVSCLNCFLGGGRLYRFEYGVSSPFFLSRVRSGTCTTAQSDPPGEVIHRAMYLLQNGFGDYDVFDNNCEDFALYCKTGLHVLDQKTLGRSGQAASVIGAPLAAIVSSPLKFFMSSPAVFVIATAGMHCLTRYATDIGVRTDVTKVKVEELTSFCNRKSSKKFINENHSDTGEVTLNQTDAPAKKRQGSM